MQRICSIPVAQAMQRHSGGWKAPSPEQPTPAPPPAENQQVAAREPERPEPSTHH
jgi:hypothetical protein